MYVGLTLSLIAHLALLGWALVSFQATPPLKVSEPEPVEVALITDDDLVRLTKGDRSSKKLKTRAAKQLEKAPVKKQAKRQRVKTVPPPAASEPPSAEKPDAIAKKVAALEPPKPPAPTLEELAKKAAATAAAELALKQAVADAAKKKAAQEAQKRKQEQAEKKRKAKAKKRKAEEAKRKKAEEKKKKLAAKRAKERERRLAEKRRRERERKQKKKFDAGKLAALLNKIPDAKAPTAGSPDPNDDRTLPKGAQAGAPEGKDTRLTASQVSLLSTMMKREVSRCWNINSGLEGIDRIVIDIEIRLKPDGYLRGQPKVASRGGGALFQDATNNAMRALVQCQPYKLPKQFYKDGWDHMVVTFDPQKMF